MIINNNTDYLNYNNIINKNKYSKKEKFNLEDIKNYSNKSGSFNNNINNILDILNNLDENLFSKNHIDEIKKIIIDIFSDNTLLSNKDKLEVLETKLKYYINNNMNDKEREKFLKIFDEVMEKIMVTFDEFYDGKYYSSELLFEVLDNIREYRELFNNY